MTYGRFCRNCLAFDCLNCISGEAASELSWIDCAGREGKNLQRAEEKAAGVGSWSPALSFEEPRKGGANRIAGQSEPRKAVSGAEAPFDAHSFPGG